MKCTLLIATLFLMFLFSRSVFADSTGTWSSAGNMSTPRVAAAATLLSNGKVLVTGGTDKYGLDLKDFNSTEVYDPATNTWSPAENMLAGGRNQTATLLPNGKVLVVGGHYLNENGIDNTLTSPEIYDPVNNTWTSAPNMLTDMAVNTATLLQNGKVLVVGSFTDYKTSTLTLAELYDPTNNIWSSAGNVLNFKISCNTATLLSNGKVLIAGGFIGESDNTTASVEIYDPTSNTWSAAASMSTERADHTETLLPNGEVLVVGGNGKSACLSSAEIYDPANNTWTSAGNSSMARVYHTATLLPNGKVLIAGGGYSEGNLIASSEIYDPINNTWTTAANMITDRCSHAATLLPNGKVLVVGGNGACLSSAEIYSPAIDNTSTTSPFSAQLQKKLQSAIVLYIGQSKAFVNNNQTDVDSTNTCVYPFIQDGSTLIPVRFVSESLGAKVDWDGDTSTVTISLGGKTVSMKINSNKISVDGVESDLEVSAQIINDRTFIPLRALVEALGKQVFWDDRGLIVICDSNVFDQTADKYLIDELVGSFTSNIEPSTTIKPTLNLEEHSMEAYKKFMKNEMKVAFDRYMPKDDMGEALYKKGSEYTLSEVLGIVTAHYFKYSTNKKIKNIDYSYIDCGKDGVNELVLRLNGMNIYDKDDDSTLVYIIKYIDGKLSLCYYYETWARSDSTINEYGYYQSGGSNGASNHSTDYGLIDKNGNWQPIVSIESETDINQLAWSDKLGQVPKVAEAKGITGGIELDTIRFNNNENVANSDEDGNKEHYYTFYVYDDNMNPIKDATLYTNSIYKEIFDEAKVPFITPDVVSTMISKKGEKVGATDEIKEGSEITWKTLNGNMFSEYVGR